MFALLVTFTLILVLLFFLLLKSGLLDDLPNILHRDRSRPREIKPEQIEGRFFDPDDNERLDVFKDFLEGSEEDREEF